MKNRMTRLEQEKRKKWLFDYIHYVESEDSEAQQLAFENMHNMSYYEFHEWAVQKGYIKRD